MEQEMNLRTFAMSCDPHTLISNFGGRKSIVKTMKTLAAVNIRHYEKAVESVSEYYRTIEMGLQVVLHRGLIELPAKRHVKDGGLCAVIFGSDQGLCGGFNDHIVSHSLNVMNE